VKIVAYMIVRNEADVILETLRGIVKWGIEEIVVLDGASDDGTLELIAGFVDADIDLRSMEDRGGRFVGHVRGDVLKMTRRHNPDWIVSVDADEIFDTDPVTAIKTAEEVGANVVRSMVPQFWITVDDVRAGLVTEDVRIPVQDRRRWYSWGHMGTFIWRDHPDHFYPKDISKRTPEMPGLTWREWQRAPGVTTICKHYPFRSLEQSVKRAKERRDRGGRKYFGKYFENWIVDEEACKLTRFDGRSWNTFPNHNLIQEYMGRRKNRRGGRG